MYRNFYCSAGCIIEAQDDENINGGNYDFQAGDSKSQAEDDATSVMKLKVFRKNF
jgi:hypothetical protein